MPTYNFRNKETGEEFEVVMKISELDEYKEKHPQFEQFITTARIGDPYTYGRYKTDSAFRRRMDFLKQANPLSNIRKENITEV